MKSHFRPLLLTVLLLSCISVARGADFYALLHAFEQHPDAERANAFFAFLDKEDFTERRLTFSPNASNDTLQQQVFYWTAEYLYDQKEYLKAQSYAEKALPLYHSDCQDKSDCLSTLAAVCMRMGNYQKAIDYARRSLEFELARKNDDRISSCMNTLAAIYLAAYQPEAAESYILQGLSHAEKANNDRRRAILLGMASEVYHALGKDDEAQTYAERRIDLETVLKREDKKAIGMAQKAAALIGLKQYKDAEMLLREVIPTFRRLNNRQSLAISLNKLGKALQEQGKKEQAIAPYREAARILHDIHDTYNALHAHRGLYECLWDSQPDSAKAELEIFNQLKDSLYSTATAESLARFNAEFENDSLRQQNMEEQQAHRRDLLIAAALLLLLLVGCTLAIRRIMLRHRRQTKNMIHEIELLRNQAERAEKKKEAADKAKPIPEMPAEPDENTRFLQRLIEVVNTELSSGEYRLEIIAEKMNMSVQTFRRRLNTASGESPKQFISAIQMERAVKLLSQKPELPISQIAHLCGFDEVSSFGRLFKRIYGCSPTQFREQLTE